MATLNQGVKKPVFDTYTGPGVLPAAVDGTGTFSILVTATRVVGTGTLFTSEARNGDYLYDENLNEARRIKHVMSDIFMELVSAFSLASVAEDVKIVRQQDISNVLQLGFLNSVIADVILDEDTLSAGTSANYGDSGGVGPMTFDATGGELKVSQKLRG